MTLIMRVLCVDSWIGRRRWVRQAAKYVHGVSVVCVALHEAHRQLRRVFRGLSSHHANSLRTALNPSSGRQSPDYGRKCTPNESCMLVLLCPRPIICTVTVADGCIWICRYVPSSTGLAHAVGAGWQASGTEAAGPMAVAIAITCNVGVQAGRG